MITEFDIWLNSYWVDELSDATRIIRHEMGHALGLEHSNNPVSLMNAFASYSNWDIETIAKLSLSYKRCEVQLDPEMNLWIPNVDLNGEGVYGILMAGTVWPDGVTIAGFSECPQ